MNLFPASLHLELFQEHPRSLFQVQRVEVQPPNAQSAVEDVPTHLGDQLDSDGSDRLVIVLYGVEDVPEMLGHDDVLPLDPCHEFLPRLDGHDPGYDGHGDPCGPNPFDPVDKDADVVEHLRKDEIGPSVHLGLEVFDLFTLVVLAFGSLWVTLGEPGDGDVKVVAILGADILDEVDSFGEPARGGLPFGLTVRRVTTEGENVLTSVFLGDLSWGSQLIRLLTHGSVPYHT